MGIREIVPTVKSRSRGLALVLLLAAGAEGLLAQELPKIDVDHAAFAYDEESAAVEVYLAFEAESLPYMERDGRFVTTVPLALSLVRASDASLDGTPLAAVWEQQQDVEFVVSDSAAIVEGQFFVRQARLIAPPGEYELVVALATGGDAPAPDVRRDIIVPDFFDSSTSRISDITIATAIGRSSDREDPFYKNGLSIMPNPNHLYGEGVAQLFYYTEVYHAEHLAGDNGQYTALIFVSAANSAGPLGGMQKRLVRQVRTPDVLVGSFALDALPTGTYFVHVVLLDESNEAQGEQAQKFFVYNPAVTAAETVELELSFESSQYVSMPEDEVESAMQVIRIIATDQEDRRIRQIKELDERRRFLMDFWKVRDPSPATTENEEFDEFYTRLLYANERYSVRSKEGWDTDRGRALIKYGAPSAIEPHLYERDLKPYELWTYHNISGAGQAIFVFADLDGFGEFQLIHSTVAGERKLVNWRQELRSSY